MAKEGPCCGRVGCEGRERLRVGVREGCDDGGAVWRGAGDDGSALEKDEARVWARGGAESCPAEVSNSRVGIQDLPFGGFQAGIGVRKSPRPRGSSEETETLAQERAQERFAQARWAEADEPRPSLPEGARLSRRRSRASRGSMVFSLRSCATQRWFENAVAQV